MTPAQFARANKLDASTIRDAIQAGKVETYEKKRNGIMRKHIDPETARNRAYVANIQIGKRMAKKPRKEIAKVSESLPVKVETAVGIGEPVQELSGDMETRYTIANVRLKEEQAEGAALKNAVRRGELLERENVYILFMHLDKLHSNLERLSDSFLADVAMKIIDAKRLTPEIRSYWKDEIFKQTNDAKEWIKSEIKNIEERQKG